MRRVLPLVAVVLVLGFSTACFADEGGAGCTICDKTTSDSWSLKAVSQLARGTANVGGCWLEMVNQPVKEMRGGGNVLAGTAKGVGHTCIRFLKGAGEIVTAPMPRAQDGSQIATDCPMCMWNAS